MGEYKDPNYKTNWARRNKEKTKIYYERGKERRKQYIAENKDRISAVRKKYLENYNKENAEKIRTKAAKKYSKTKEIVLSRSRDRYRNDPEYRKKKLQQVKRYRENNKEKVTASKKKNVETLNGKIARRLRHRIRETVKSQSTKKGGSLEYLIGTSVEHLKQHLESQFQPGMSWENYGEWHIDHIVPCSLFDLTKIYQQKSCFNYKNLQPLFRKVNLTKHAILETCPV